MPVKILVVDDEPDLELLVRQKFRRQIREKEFEFHFAHNGVEALELLDTDPEIEVVMTDINMPVMDGLTLLARIGDLDRIIKTIVVSAYGDMDNIRAAMNRGAYDFLTKPMSFEDLDITLNKTVQRVGVLRQSLMEHEQLVAIQQELNVATRIQQSILPCDFPPFPSMKGFDLFGTMIPAREVGGDFYDFFLLDQDRLGLVIGDVSGKGVPAAIFMAVSRTLLKSVALTGIAPGDCMQQVNQLLSLENSSFMFVTLFYGILNIRTGEFEFCNAGHNPPFLITRNGHSKVLATPSNIALGVDENFSFNTETSCLNPEDTLYLYTDGVTEAFNIREEMFTEVRLQKTLDEAAGLPPKQVIRMVVEAVESFAAGTPQSDDLTMMVIRYNP
jgi:sigma-B regulation protein RsbU (phosphoserine phosphatase)